MGVLYGILAGAGALAIIVKSHTLTLRETPFVEAATSVGGQRSTHIPHPPAIGNIAANRREFLFYRGWRDPHRVAAFGFQPHTG